MVIKLWIESDNKSPLPKSLQCGEGKKNGFVRRVDKWSFHIQKCFIFIWVIVGLSKSFKMPHILAVGTESLCQKSSFFRSLRACTRSRETRSCSCSHRPHPRSLAMAVLVTPWPSPPRELWYVHVRLLGAHQSGMAFRCERGHRNSSVEVSTNWC